MWVCLGEVGYPVLIVGSSFWDKYHQSKLIHYCTPSYNPVKYWNLHTVILNKWRKNAPLKKKTELFYELVILMLLDVICSQNTETHYMTSDSKLLFLKKFKGYMAHGEGKVVKNFSRKSVGVH